MRDARNPLANTTLVTALITERPLCVECIGKQCSLSTEDAETVLTVLRSVVAIQRHAFSRCRLCRRARVTFSVVRPSAERHS
jgi:hypothetical protein